MADITVDRTGDTTNRHTFVALESDTLVKALFDAIENEWSQNAIEVLIREICKKGYDDKRLLNLVETRYGKATALKIIRIIFNQ